MNLNIISMSDNRQSHCQETDRYIIWIGSYQWEKKSAIMKTSLIHILKMLSVDWTESWEKIRVFIDENLKQSLRECLLCETDDVMVTSVALSSFCLCP